MRASLQAKLGDRAVSPVIAVILLLAITVVLASVMYITISSLMPSAPQNPTPLGASVTRRGTQWEVEVIAVSSGVSTSSVYMQVLDSNGSTLIPTTPLANFTGFMDLSPTGILNPGDRIHLPVALYPAGCWIILGDNQKVLYRHELNG